MKSSYDATRGVKGADEGLFALYWEQDSNLDGPGKSSVRKGGRLLREGETQKKGVSSRNPALPRGMLKMSTT